MRSRWVRSCSAEKYAERVLGEEVAVVGGVALAKYRILGRCSERLVDVVLDRSCSF
jgi:hypothetical protein